MPFCTFCGLELTPKENDLFFCEKCGTYFETVKQNTPSAADVGAESRFVVTKTFKIFGTQKTVVSGYVQGNAPLALPGRAHLTSTYNGNVQEIMVSSFRLPQNPNQSYSLIVEGLPSGAIQGGDVITTSNITPQQSYGADTYAPPAPSQSNAAEKVYTPNAVPQQPAYSAPQQPTYSAPQQPTYAPPAPPVAEDPDKAGESHLVYLFGMKFIEVFGGREFYNNALECNLEGIDFDVNAEGFGYKMFTRDWKIITEEPCQKFSDIKARNREEWGADIIDKEPDRVDNPKARKAMLKALMTNYIGKIPFFDVDVKIGRATFNRKPF